MHRFHLLVLRGEGRRHRRHLHEELREQLYGTLAPFIIGQQLFPQHQTGLDLFGSHHVGDYKLGFHLTATNGRGGAEAIADQDNGLALGGRLELETTWGLKAGVSYYRGRFTGLPAAIGVLPETYLEASVGGDAQLDLAALHLQAEVIGQDRHYPGGHRTALGPGFVPDFRAIGTYVLAGYRFEQLWNVMPYAYYGAYQAGDPTVQSGTSIDIGLNFRPESGLVYKLQGSDAPRSLPSSAHIAKIVAKFPGAIGYLAADQVTADVQAVSIDGVAFSDPRYPIVMP